MEAELTNQQRLVALQRVTALWAFCESGLGGVLHAFHIPVTGLVLGSISVICICLIGFFSKKKYNTILKSLVVVLIVKAVVSPQTPFPAYIAVGFQAVTGFVLFSFLRINFISILILAVGSMLESALQKLLLLTLFFGKTFWSGIDEMVKFIMKPFGLYTTYGSYWVIGIYLLVYIGGGIFTAIISQRLLVTVSRLRLPDATADPVYGMALSPGKRSGWTSKFLLLIAGTGILIFSGFYKGESAGMIRSVVWTLAAVTIWYLLITPVITRLLQKLLSRSGNRYKIQASEIIAFLPYFRKISLQSWEKAGNKPRIKKIPSFLSILVTSVLTFSPKSVSPKQ